MSEKITQKDIDKLIKLYFSQPNILYKHLFSSFHQFIEEIIPSSLSRENNYFYENITKDSIYLHGFKCMNVRIRPPIIESNSEILSPKKLLERDILIIFLRYLPMFNK